MLWSLIKVLLFIAAIAGLTYGADLLLHSEEGLRIAVAGWEFTLGPVAGRDRACCCWSRCCGW